MNDRSYDRLANVLMLVAVASALMFDAGVLPKIVIGAVGGIAALASVYMYFSNQSIKHEVGAEPPRVRAEAKAEMPVVPMVKAGSSAVAQQTTADLAARWAVMVAKREKHYVVVHHHRHINLKVANRAFYGGILVHQDIAESNVVLSPDDVAACAIEIIQQLSKKDGDDRWEFHFGANGLRVSSKKGHAESAGSISLQEGFDFLGYMPTTMVQ
jgi:hypothetical protein